MHKNYFIKMGPLFWMKSLVSHFALFIFLKIEFNPINFLYCVIRMSRKKDENIRIWNKKLDYWSVETTTSPSKKEFWCISFTNRFAKEFWIYPTLFDKLKTWNKKQNYIFEKKQNKTKKKIYILPLIYKLKYFFPT